MGITGYAKEQLGEIVHAEFPKTGKSLKKGQETVVLESVKTTAHVYSPLDGVLKNTNNVLEKDLDKFEQTPAEELWLMEIECEKEPQGFLNSEEYQKLIKH